MRAAASTIEGEIMFGLGKRVKRIEKWMNDWSDGFGSALGAKAKLDTLWSDRSSILSAVNHADRAWEAVQILSWIEERRERLAKLGLAARLTAYNTMDFATMNRISTVRLVVYRVGADDPHVYSGAETGDADRILEQLEAACLKKEPVAKATRKPRRRRTTKTKVKA
jgi:hypothetical protein